MHRFLLAGRWRCAAHRDGASTDVIQTARGTRRATHDGFVRRTKTVRVRRRYVIAGNARHLAVVSFALDSLMGHDAFGKDEESLRTATRITTIEKRMTVSCFLLSANYIYAPKIEKKSVLITCRRL